MTKTLKKALTVAFCLLCAFMAGFSVINGFGGNVAYADGGTTDITPKFSVVDGRTSGGKQDYDALGDGNTNTKYCISIKNSPYVTFMASESNTVVSGYKIYTANDTATYSGRNPVSWKLYGSNVSASGAWTEIDAKTNDTSLKAENRTAYEFTVNNTAAYLFYKIEFTARQGKDGTDSNLMQVSEFEFIATVAAGGTAEVEVKTADGLTEAFANGGKVKLTGDIALDTDLELYKKTLEVDLNGYVVSGGSIKVFAASTDRAATLIVKDSRPDAPHTDANLPKGGVITDIRLTRKTEDGVHSNPARLYANGGTVKNTVVCDTGSAVISVFYGSTPTVFLNGVKGCGITLDGGLYYKQITADYPDTSQYKTNVKKVTFKSEGKDYAWAYVRRNVAVVRPVQPTVSGLEFIGWYGSNKQEYDFGTMINADSTITAMYMKEVATYEQFTKAINSGYSVRLMADFNCTLFQITDGKYPTIDLNGHVLSGAGIEILSPSNTRVTLIDSNPDATHTDKKYPKGGYIERLSVKRDSDKDNAYLVANGGTIGNLGSNSDSYAHVISTSSTPTVIQDVGANYLDLKAGTFYYDEEKLSKSEKAVKFMDGEKFYAKIATEAKTVAAPVAPTKEGVTFDGWYNGETKYDFTTPFTASLTLQAKWIDDVNPVISGVDKDKVYCGSVEITVADYSSFTVTVDGENQTVTSVDGKTLNTGKFTLDMSDKRNRTVVVTDGAGNVSTVTVKHGHIFGEWVDEVSAEPCVTDGVKGHKDCLVCNKHFDSNGVEIENLTIEKHTFGEWNEKVNETCDTDGVKAYKDCFNCNKHFDENGAEITELKIAASGHDFGAWIDEVPATDKKEGVKAHKGCSVCHKHFDSLGEEITDLSIAKLPVEDLSVGAIVAISVGGVAVAGLGGFAVVWFVVKKKTFAELLSVITGIFKK